MADPLEGTPIEAVGSAIGGALSGLFGAATPSSSTPSPQVNDEETAAAPTVATPAPSNPAYADDPNSPAVHPAAQVAVADANAQTAAVTANATASTPTPPPAPQATPAPSFVSPADQQAISSNMANADEDDMSSGGTALAAFNSASSGTGDNTDIMSAISAELQQIQTASTTPPPSLLSTYQQQMTQMGIPQEQQELVNYQTLMNGTTDDIRTELTAHGGFATESQIQALASARNSSLQLTYNSIQDGLSLQEQYVQNYMQYYSQDLTNATAAANNSFKLQDTLLKTLGTLQTADQTAQYRFQTQQMNKLKVVLDSGGLAGASPSVLASYSASTGIDMQTLQNAATNDNDKLQLSMQLQNANIAYKDARINPGAQITSSKLQSYVAAGIPAAAATAIQSKLMAGETLENIRQDLAGTYGHDTGYHYLDAFMPIFQSGSTKNYTAANIPSDTKAQLVADLSSGQYTMDQIIGAYPEVDTSYISSLQTSLAQ